MKTGIIANTPHTKAISNLVSFIRERNIESGYFK